MATGSIKKTKPFNTELRYALEANWIYVNNEPTEGFEAENCMYFRVGDIVFVRGRIKPTNDLSPVNAVTIFDSETFPESDIRNSYLCSSAQDSDVNMYIDTSGRLRIMGKGSVLGDKWITFNGSYMASMQG